MIILVKFLELGLQLLRDKPKEQYKMIDSLLNLVFPATIKERHTIGFLGATGTVYHIQKDSLCTDSLKARCLDTKHKMLGYICFGNFTQARVIWEFN